MRATHGFFTFPAHPDEFSAHSVGHLTPYGGLRNSVGPFACSQGFNFDLKQYVGVPPFNLQRLGCVTHFPHTLPTLRLLPGFQV